MNTTNRDLEVMNKARNVALSQGYSLETAAGFAEWILDYCPEVQSYSNLLDYYISRGHNDNYTHQQSR